MNPQIRELHYLPIWKYSAWRNQKYWQRASSSGLLKSSEMLTSVECNRTIQQTSSIETRIGMEMIPRDSSASIFTLSTPSANKIHLRSISRSLRSSWDDFQALWIRINSNKDLSSLSLPLWSTYIVHACCVVCALFEQCCLIGLIFMIRPAYLLSWWNEGSMDAMITQWWQACVQSI